MWTATAEGIGYVGWECGLSCVLARLLPLSGRANGRFALLLFYKVCMQLCTVYENGPGWRRDRMGMLRCCLGDDGRGAEEGGACRSAVGRAVYVFCNGDDDGRGRNRLSWEVGW